MGGSVSVSFASNEAPPFLTEGMQVAVPHVVGEGDTRTTYCICTVENAAGDAGRVLNERRGIDKWVKRVDMRTVLTI